MPLSIVQPDPELRPLIAAIAIRMADEGIPIRAIARSTRLTSDEVYETLRDAVGRGVITELPRDDWAADKQRTDRNPFLGSGLEDDQRLKIACARCFKATRLEAAMLALLLKRREATKSQLHLVIEQNRPGENQDATDPKMVDVIICKLRKKLKPWDIEIGTIWGIGYLLEPVHRDKAILLLQSLAAGSLPAAPMPAPVISDIEIKVAANG